MKFESNKVSAAVRIALSMGAFSAVGTVTAIAQDAAGSKNQSLETIVVTGSNIRRVDIETANPVITIDRAAIQQSGKTTLGDLVQQLPSVAGGAMNPQVNNGGVGTAGVSLRGLGSNRTLLLINGHRIPSQLQDLNMIPIGAVERIEVLNDGASAIYGSDAIAGVVNIITRSNYQGAEFGADYGISDHDDGERKAIHAIFGQSTDHGSILFGFQYDKQDGISAANRSFSKNAEYNLPNAVNPHAGSARTPSGSFFLPSTSAIAKSLGCKETAAGSGTVQLTLKSGVTNATKASDYRCYDASSDGFNFQAVGNYDLVPNERTGLFALGNYKLTDHVEAYAEALYHKTVTHTQLAPLPFDLEQDNLSIPANQYYNPFGVAFGMVGDSDNLLSRTIPIGNRGRKFSNTTESLNAGLKGAIGGTSWTWDGHFSYGKLTLEDQRSGYIDIATIADDFSCPTAPGAGTCAPINIFNLSDPNTQAILKSAEISPFETTLYQMKSFEVQATGNLFSLPAGDVSLAVGGNYRKEYLDSQVDPLVNTTFTNSGGVITLNCDGPGSICSSPAQGGFNVKEAYAELLVPILKDVSFAHSLNLSLGDRYSRYSNFGSTNNWKVALEYRPIEDLLLRATVSKVFRAPSPSDLFSGPTADQPSATDPCAGNSGAASNPACQGYKVPPEASSQRNAYVMGSQFANDNLGTKSILNPENGKSFSYGFVYDPHWLPGLSINADYYRILLDNLIVSGPGIAQTILTQCFNAGGSICSDIVRNTDGSINYIVEAPFNSGSLVDQGFDAGIHYRLPETAYGAFRFGLDGTYIQNWNITQGGFTQHLAGHYDKTFGNFSRVRIKGSVDWNLGPFVAGWTTRFFSPLTLGYANPCLGPSAAQGGSAVGCNNYSNLSHAVLHYGAMTYHDFNIGYNIEPINTFVSVGIDNVFDKHPPILFLNNTANANTDVNTYDTIGRYYHANFTIKF